MRRKIILIATLTFISIFISCKLITGPNNNLPDTPPELSLPFESVGAIDHLGSIYGQIIDFGDRREPHQGIDIVGKADGTSVIAAAPGVVKSVIWDTENDNTFVSIQCSKNHLVIYLFEPAKEIFVKEGEEVERGQQIGTLSMRAGKTGQCCLHFGMKMLEGDVWICPVQYFSKTLIDQLCSIHNSSSPWYNPEYPDLCTCSHGKC